MEKPIPKLKMSHTQRRFNMTENILSKLPVGRSRSQMKNESIKLVSNQSLN